MLIIHPIFFIGHVHCGGLSILGTPLSNRRILPPIDISQQVYCQKEKAVDALLMTIPTLPKMSVCVCAHVFLSITKLCPLKTSYIHR